MGKTRAYQYQDRASDNRCQYGYPFFGDQIQITHNGDARWNKEEHHIIQKEIGNTLDPFKFDDFKMKACRQQQHAYDTRGNLNTRKIDHDLAQGKTYEYQEQLSDHNYFFLLQKYYPLRIIANNDRVRILFFLTYVQE